MSTTDIERRALRRRRLRSFSLPALVLMLVGLKLISVPLVAAWSDGAYRAGRYDTSGARLKLLHPLNIIQPWIVDFNEGDSSFRDGRYPAAARSFRAALLIAPDDRQCDVRLNLVLSYEAHATSLLHAGTTDRAIAELERARSVIDEGARCFKRGGSSGSTRRKLTSAKARVARASKQAKSGRKGSGKGRNARPKDNPATAKAPSARVRKQLESQQRQAQRERSQSQAHASNYDAPSAEWDARNW